MAEKETNPVLQIIDINKPLIENKKYPAGLLQFNQTGWRAYYHSHPAARAGNHHFKGEHGHFHIFVCIQTNPEKWSHLVALAMDNMGQPLGWFTVNHWVTAEEWLAAGDLTKYLENIPFDKPEILVERYILSLLHLSKDKINKIIFERDKIIQQKKYQIEKVDVTQNKQLYLLSEISINMKQLLGVENNND